MLMTQLFALEIKFVLKIESNMQEEFYRFFLKKPSREALTVLGSTVKHAGSC